MPGQYFNFGRWLSLPGLFIENHLVADPTEKVHDFQTWYRSRTFLTVHFLNFTSVRSDDGKLVRIAKLVVQAAHDANSAGRGFDFEFLDPGLSLADGIVDHGIHAAVGIRGRHLE